MARTLVGTPVVSKTTVDDLILWELERRFTRHSIDLDAGTYVIGEVIVDAMNDIADDAVGKGPAFTDALILENIVVPYGETISVPCLCRGPALVNLDAVVRTTNETDDNLKTRLGDLIGQGVRFVREPVNRTETDQAA